jgi:hypothetical protein
VSKSLAQSGNVPPLTARERWPEVEPDQGGKAERQPELPPSHREIEPHHGQPAQRRTKILSIRLGRRANGDN